MKKIKEIKAEYLNPEEFIRSKTREISRKVGAGIAINALSGGVDSSVVTMLGHKALGDKLKTYFIDNGLMRQGEPQKVVSFFKSFGVRVELINAQREFFKALRGVTNPEKKREAVTHTFYKDVFGRLVRESSAKYLLQGTILTDVDETAAGIKRQHNVFAQIGIDPLTALGYQIIEPLVQLRKDGVRKVAAALGLPKSVYNRMPFPGPALAARIIGKVTPEKIRIVKLATEIVEKELAFTKAFQYLAILHDDRVTGMRDGKRIFGLEIEVRCWDSVDARTAKPTDLSNNTRDKVAKEIAERIPEVVNVTFGATPKPPSTIEAI
jgi:GMP synthase (glutamine-hydrolysing)